MGLAASQARLLTITSRKADCEFQSMRYSHQKIALSRNMTDISNEYQNSLNQTKLVYDYYGNNDKSLALTYGLLMTPSELNGHMPVLTTDSSGRIVLNSAYAAAAKAAGIPQEGLGCLPSTTVRNKFIEGLAGAGLITPEAAATYQGITYAQEMGLGTTDLVTATIEQMTLDEMMDHYLLNGDMTLYAEFNAGVLKAQTGGNSAVIYNGDNSSSSGSVNKTNLNIIDVLNNDYQYIIIGSHEDDDRADQARSFQNLDIWNWMFEELANMLNVTGNAQIAGAIQVAEAMTRELLDYDKHGTSYSTSASKKHSTMNSDKTSMNSAGEGFIEFLGFGQNGKVSTSDHFGVVNLDREGNAWNHKPRGLVSIDISNIAKAYLTYFAQYMEGGERYSEYKVDAESNRVDSDNTHLIDDEFKFDVLVDQGINTNQALNSGFYDAMFNQLCLKGWVENPNIDDRDYLQEMLQSGVLFISTCNDDGNYYQGNYSTNSFIKEVADEEAIARAEAKYNTEKQKINSKEEALDLKMKNLDTEISSLTTEYDTVKSVISKNIEKSFKRYDA